MGDGFRPSPTAFLENERQIFANRSKLKAMTFNRVCLVLLLGVVACAAQSAPINPVSTTSNGIVFVTQVPMRDDFTTIASTFGNHLSSIQSVPRGGDLWIRYSNGSLKNLTKAAGYGMDGLQAANAIAAFVEGFGA